MELRFWVPSNRTAANGRPTHMDGINEIVGSGLTNRNLAGRRKRENTQHVAQFAARAMEAQGWRKPSCPVSVETVWHETNDRRDLDNIYGGIKYVLDGICTPSNWSSRKHDYARNPFGCGAIQDDSQKYVGELVYSMVIDPENPGVEVIVTTLEEQE
nr:hypothetical protein [uncultured Olsenella sp.]